MRFGWSFRAKRESAVPVSERIGYQRLRNGESRSRGARGTSQGVDAPLGVLNLFAVEFRPDSFEHGPRQGGYLSVVLQHKLDVVSDLGN
jgi:hypothetical protein